MKNFNNEKILLLIVIFIAVLLLVKTIKFPVTGTVDIAIMRQRGAILTLDTPQKISSTKHISIDSINFLHSQMLEHPSLGKLGYSRNIFLKAKTQMNVLNAGKYNFFVTSDDGFRLKIDDKMICEHPTDRPMQTTLCSIFLNKHKHKFELLYFQGGGPMGLKVKYKLKDKTDSYFVGKDSKYVKFKEIK